MTQTRRLTQGEMIREKIHEIFNDIIDWLSEGGRLNSNDILRLSPASDVVEKMYDLLFVEGLDFKTVAEKNHADPNIITNVVGLLKSMITKNLAYLKLETELSCEKNIRDVIDELVKSDRLKPVQLARFLYDMMRLGSLVAERHRHNDMKAISVVIAFLGPNLARLNKNSTPADEARLAAQYGKSAVLVSELNTSDYKKPFEKKYPKRTEAMDEFIDGCLYTQLDQAIEILNQYVADRKKGKDRYFVTTDPNGLYGKQKKIEAAEAVIAYIKEETLIPAEFQKTTLRDGTLKEAVDNCLAVINENKVGKLKLNDAAFKHCPSTHSTPAMK